MKYAPSYVFRVRTMPSDEVQTLADHAMRELEAKRFVECELRRDQRHFFMGFGDEDRVEVDDRRQRLVVGAEHAAGLFARKHVETRGEIRALHVFARPRTSCTNNSFAAS